MTEFTWNGKKGSSRNINPRGNGFMRKIFAIKQDHLHIIDETNIDNLHELLNIFSSDTDPSISIEWLQFLQFDSIISFFLSH